MNKYILAILFLFITTSAVSQRVKEEQEPINNKKEATNKQNSSSGNKDGSKTDSDTGDKTSKKTGIKAAKNDPIDDVNNSQKVKNTESNVVKKVAPNIFGKLVYFHWKNLILYLAAFIIGILLTYIFVRKKFEKKLKKLVEEKSHYKKKLEEKINDIKDLEKKTKNLENEKNDLHKNLNNTPIVLSPQRNDTESIIEIVDQSTKEWEIEKIVEPTRPLKILYFPNPNLDGTFKLIGGKETFTDGASIYKFTLEDESNANIEFCDDQASIKIALNNRNEMILSIAIETNQYKANATQILIVDNKKAKAQLKGNVWVIKEKAKIKYV